MSASQKIGIMGEIGSFSHEAADQWLSQQHPGKKYITEFLVSADRVLAGLINGTVDLGILALQNASGGIIRETVESLAVNPCQIVEYFSLHISQCVIGKTVLKRPTAIHSHPHALAQCSIFLNTEYAGVPNVEETDTALAARKLSEGHISDKDYVVASEYVADLYGLKIIHQGIQNMQNNITDFIVVKSL